MRTFMIYSLCNFQIYNTVLLTIVTMLYTTSLWFICFITGILIPLEYQWVPLTQQLPNWTSYFSSITHICLSLCSSLQWKAAVFTQLLKHLWLLQPPGFLPLPYVIHQKTKTKPCYHFPPSHVSNLSTYIHLLHLIQANIIPPLLSGFCTLALALSISFSMHYLHWLL